MRRIGIVTLYLFFGAVVSLTAHAGQDERPQGPSETDGTTDQVSVAFITNRARQGGQTTIETFSGDRGQPGFGRCTTAFSAIPIMNEVAAWVPFYVPTESKEIQAEEISDADTFWNQFTETVAQTSSGSVVLFVHGYNYGLERTCRMAAEMQRGLAGRASVLVFSWPSNAQASAYVSDQTDLEWSVPFLVEILAKLARDFGSDRVQVVAHSLGSRGILFGLERLASVDEARPLISRLVLMAPDYDTQTFRERFDYLSPLIGDITLYASSQDTPLQVSQRLSGYPRLGQAGEYLTVVPGLDTIDVSTAGRYQILGHEYFYYHPSVAADLVELLATGKPASQRRGLRQRQQGSLGYWEVRPMSQ